MKSHRKNPLLCRHFVYHTFTAENSGNYKVTYKINCVEEVGVLLKERMGTYIQNVIVRFQVFYECCVRSFRNKVDVAPFAQFCLNSAKRRAVHLLQD